jgi:DnaK suppressor protein
MSSDREKIRQRILKEVARTQILIEEYKDLTKPVAPDDSIGRITRMDAINNKSVTEASLRQAEEKLRNLQRVLSRAESSEFGLCIKCAKPIPEARILYRPESLHCVDCAS